MVQSEREVHVLRRAPSSAYVVTNIKWHHQEKSKIGSSISGRNAMMERDMEMRVYLRGILAVSPDSPNWDAELKKYWDNIGVNIPEGGKILQIGFKCEVDMVKDSVALKVLESHKLDTDEKLMDYVEGFSTKDATPNVREEEKYRYATPINVADYVLWRYCLVYSDVANHISLVEKSPRIRFYLHNPEDSKKEEKAKFKEVIKASKKLMEIMGNSQKVLFMLRNLVAVDENIDKLDEDERVMRLKAISEATPETFLRVEADKNLETKAFIYECLNRNLIRTIPNTNTIVNQDGESVGTSMEEAIAYFKDATHKAFTSTLEAQLKALPKK